MPHPLVDQLRFTRAEFLRGVKQVNEEEASRRFMPMNCISWNVGHLAWHEQRYFLHIAQGQMPLPEINRDFAYGCPASTPSLKAVLAAWQAITQAADPWLDALTSERLLERAPGKDTSFGNLLQRVIYHYWYHTGENQAIRQMLGHTRLPVFVGSLDTKAPYRPDLAEPAENS
ncbi:MAG TPA: DinB family protein [Anaerolineaceae bacterium]|nr:DinB family protein [Anaerolineaceae bacterium]